MWLKEKLHSSFIKHAAPMELDEFFYYQTTEHSRIRQNTYHTYGVTRELL